MPSLRSLLLGVGLATLTLLHTSSASPVPVAPSDTCAGPDPSKTPTPTRVADPTNTPTPILSVSTDATPLPSTNKTLIAVGLGRGIQNYTCATATSVPVAIGAVATLFDITKLTWNDENLANSMPAKAVYMPLPQPGKSPFAVLGVHYFNASGTPVFDLTSASKIFFGKKTGDIKAPTDADKGPDGTGAVDYLQLLDKGDSVGISAVYRVVTAGGAAPAVCNSTDVISIQYAAQYWFYD